MDVAPKQKTTPQQRVAQLLRSLGTHEREERRRVWEKLGPAMELAKVNWNDVGNALDGKYTEAEMQQYAQAEREAGVDAGIKIGLARASNDSSNGHFMTLPAPPTMAQHCYDQINQLESKHHRFVNEMIVRARFLRKQSRDLRTLGYLASIYIQTGGKV